MIAYTEYKLRAYDKEGNLVCSTVQERYEAKIEAKIEALAKELRANGYTVRITEYIPTCTGV